MSTRRPKTIIVLALVVLCLIVLVQNTRVVDLRLLFWKTSMSQIVLMTLAILIGFVLGYIVTKTKKRKN